jgi:cellulose synthase operon protein C
MTSTSRTGNALSGAPAQDSALVVSTIARLRAEQVASKVTSREAVLLHEIGVLEEAVGDEATAARDQLAAVNAEPEFTEPLERLIAIIERRQSYRNLGKLLDRLVKVAVGSSERARALMEQAFFLEDHEHDLGTARTLVEQAAEEAPDDPAVWLALELIALKSGDLELRETALTRRAALVQRPEWQTLLLLDLAELRAKKGDREGATTALDLAVSVEGRTKYLALCRADRLGRALGDASLEARCLEAQAALILEAIADAAQGDASGVPLGRRTKAHAADAWLRAAEVHRRTGAVPAATDLLDRALAELPGDPALTHARLTAAEAAGDARMMARLSRAVLEAGAHGELAAALWLRVAEAAAADADGPGALDAVRRALAEDARSIPARALELDLLASSGDGAALAGALETTAERVTTDRARAGFYLLAADAYARQARDAQGARAALSQAGMSGAAPGLVARVGRLLATTIDDTAWFEESTRRVITQGASPDEQTSLWLELVRARALRSDRVALDQALDAVAATPGGAWLGHALAAYLPAVLPKPGSDGETRPPPPDVPLPKAWDPLLALARDEQAADVARAERLAAALRAITRSERAVALELLETLHTDEPADPITAVAVAGLEMAERPERAARALLSCASATDDADLAAALRVEAGLLQWRAGAITNALEAFELAADGADSTASVLFAWALRAAQPNEVKARRRALEASESVDAATTALERFTLEIGPEGQEAAARAALGRSQAVPASGVGLAAVLARAIWDGNDRDDRSLALDTLAERSAAASSLARAAAFELELARANGSAPDAAETEAAAARWAEADARPAAALEWLAFAVAKADVSAEVSARRALAARLDGVSRETIEAGASLAAWLTGLEEPPPLAAESPQAVLANLEIVPPGSEPKRRGAALSRAAPWLGEDALPVTRALAGYNQLAAGETEAALATFRGVVEAMPNEVIGWEGLRAAAEMLGAREVLAEACAALGDAVRDETRGAELWEVASGILLDELGDKERGEFALGRAVERDVRRSKAFDRLFRIVRERKDGARLLDLIARRLDVAEDPDEIVKMFWERARVMRASGDREGALAALENVRMLEPDHVGALALSGEIHLTLQQFGEAADQLAKLSTLSAAPTQQRLMSGVAAVDIYENKLKSVQKALDVLIGLHESKLSTPQVRERLARVAAKAGAWERAASTFELLMRDRDTSAGRAEAARLALAIRRDRLSQPASARESVERLLEELPGDGEGLDLVLSRVFPEAFAAPLLERGRDAVAEALVADPFEMDAVERLSRIAAAVGDDRLRQAALGALATLGVDPIELDAELQRLDRRVARVPSIAIDDASLPGLADPADGGPIADLMRELGPSITAAIGPNLAALGAQKRERVDPRAGHPIRNEIIAWAGALGIGELEVYVGGRNPHGIYGVASEPPSLVVGSLVAAPLSAMHRQGVARELFALRRGTNVLGHREPPEVAALIVAACKLGGVELEAPTFAMLGEFQRQLGKEVPRRVRKLLPELGVAIRDSGQDLTDWYRAATSTLDRMAAVAAGDVSWVLCGDAANRGRMPASVEGQERARRLLSFVLSPAYLVLREMLGMGVR